MLIKAFILPVSAMCWSLKNLRKPENNCFQPILQNWLLMRLLAKTVFLVIPTVSIPKKQSEYQEHAAKISRKYHAGNHKASERNT